MTKEFPPVPDAEQVTDEMIDAVVALRNFASGKVVYMSLPEAVRALDKAGFFTPVDEAMDRDDEMHARLMAGLRGIDLGDRYPVGDEDGVIGRAGEGPGFLGRQVPDNH